MYPPRFTAILCLAQNYGWVSTCGAHEAPPSNIEPGDVLVYHASSCSDSDAHATIVTDVPSDGDVKITCHSTDYANRSYTDYSNEFGYYNWLHYVG